MIEKSKQKEGDNMEITPHSNSGKEIAMSKGLFDHTAVILGYNSQINDLVIGHNHPSTGVTLMPLRQLVGDKDYWFTGRRSQFSIDTLIDKYNRQAGKSYNALFDNCQHFSSSLIDGREKSSGVQGALAVTGILLFLYVISNKKASR